jgi:two-component sensor histidine kinase
VNVANRLFLFTVAAFIPLFVVLFLLEKELRRERVSEVRGLAERQTLQANSEVARIVEAHRVLLTAITSAPSVQALDEPRCTPYLESLSRRLPWVSGLGVIDLEGNGVCASTPSRRRLNYADRPYLAQAVTSRDFVLGIYTVSKVDPSLKVLPMAMPILADDGSVSGVVALGLKLSYLQEKIEAWSLPPEGSLTIADAEGTILARNPLPDRFVGTRIPKDFVRRFVQAQSPGLEEVVSQDGTRRLLAYVPASVEPVGLYVSSGIAVDQAFAILNRSWWWTSVLIITGLAAAAATSLVAGRYLIRSPVSDLLRLAGDRAAGLPPEVPRPIPGTEFERIAAALDQMAQAIEQRKRLALEQQDLLVRELHHRVKNLLTLVQAIGRQTASATGAPAEFSLQFTERLQALARTTDMLTARQWDGVLLRDLIQSELDAMPRGERATLTGPDIELPPEIALSVVLIMHELATNAVKHGALSLEQAEGRLAVSWWLEEATSGQRLHLEWREHCTRPASTTAGSGFGTKLIRRMLSALGRGDWKLTDSGALFMMEVQLFEASARDRGRTAETGVAAHLVLAQG